MEEIEERALQGALFSWVLLTYIHLRKENGMQTRRLAAVVLAGVVWGLGCSQPVEKEMVGPYILYPLPWPVFLNFL